MITTEIRPRVGGHRDDGHEEEILQADSETKQKVTNNDGDINLKHHLRIRAPEERRPHFVMGSGELPDAQCARREEPMIRREQAVGHDLDGASDQDIMFGHARDEAIAHSLTTSIGKDLTDRHKNSDVWRLQPGGKTRSTVT